MKYIRISLSLFLLYLLVVTNLYSQNQKEIIAEAGELTITKSEFLKRFEFTPHVRSSSGKDIASTKRDFVYTLLAEKLLAQQAMKERIDTSHDFKIMMEYIRNIYLRDALYRLEIKTKVVVPDTEIAKGEDKTLKTLQIKYLVSSDSTEIKNIYSALQKGASFDSILTSRSESKEQPLVSEVNFGTLDERMENVVYKLLPGQYSLPVRLKDGWYICKLYSVSSKTTVEDNDLNRIKKVISSRVEDKLYEEFYKKFFNKINVSMDSGLFISLAKNILNYLKENEKTFIEKRSNKFRLSERDVNVLRKNFTPPQLGSMFIKLENNPVTLEKFLDYFMLEGFEAEQINEQRIKSRLHSFVSRYTQNELLAMEARKRGLDKLPDVNEDLQMWSNYYLSNRKMAGTFKQGPVTDDEALKFYAKSQGIIIQPELVKIAEILLPDLTTVETVYKEIENRIDFLDLAKKYTIRDSLKARSGVFDYFSVDENNDYGKIVKQMKIGDIYGPIKVIDGYSIIKLLDRKESAGTKYSSFAEAKDDIKGILRTRKMYQKLNDVTAKLGVEQGIKINEGLLNSIKTTEINMMVFRRFAFGGQLTATPFAADFSSWFKSYLQLKKKLSL